MFSFFLALLLIIIIFVNMILSPLQVLVAQQHAITLARVAAFQGEFNELNTLRKKAASLRSFVENKFQLADHDYERALKGLPPEEYDSEAEIETEAVGNLNNGNDAMREKDLRGAEGPAADGEAAQSLPVAVVGAFFTHHDNDNPSPENMHEQGDQDKQGNHGSQAEQDEDTAGENQQVQSPSRSRRKSSDEYSSTHDFRDTPNSNNASGMESSLYASIEAAESDVDATSFRSPESEAMGSAPETSPESDATPTSEALTEEYASQRKERDAATNWPPHPGMHQVSN
jgi:hypothetical protein